MIPILLLILLFAMPAVSIQGASNGLLLWFHIVLPTLAPFMICTQLITMFGGIKLFMRPCAPFFRHIFHLSSAGGYVLLCGLLCGYPIGAKLCAEFCRQGLISEQEGKYLLSICNHPSPMFLLGYVKNQLPTDTPDLLILLCMYLPILPISFAAKKVYHIHRPSAKNLSPKSAHKMSLDEILMSVCDTLVLIGGYIMLFSILSAWIREIPIFSVKTKALLSGIAEITTGVHQICSCKAFSLPLLPVIASVSFGGLSGIFQTRSVLSRTSAESSNESDNTYKACKRQLPSDTWVTKNAGLSIRHYLFWKLLHMICSCFTLVLLLQVVPLQ